jgi:hypothetical protein
MGVAHPGNNQGGGALSLWLKLFAELLWNDV